MWLGFTLLLGIAIVPICLAASKESYEIENYEFNGNKILSTPEECLRTCREDEPPKVCYYHFTLENYNTLGAACRFCTPNGTHDPVSSKCQCVVADGMERAALTANRMIPGPSIQVCEGDKVVVDVANRIEGAEAAIHWHGVFQNGFQYYDGVPSVTQCPIAQSSTFRYQWEAANPGTHFWHSHAGLHELEGLYGSLVIRQPLSKDPSSSLYDDDLSAHIILISDWMHESAGERFPGFSEHNVGQTPASVLINGLGRYTDPKTGSITNTSLAVFTITSGRRYRFRLINAFATVCPAQISFEGHELSIIASDGESVHPVAVNTIVSFAGERYDFVITADQPVGAYWIQLRGLGECGENRIQSLAVLRYEDGPDEPSSAAPTYDDGLRLGVLLNPLDAVCHLPRDDAVCVNQLRNAEEVDQRILQERADVKIFLPYRFSLITPEELFQTNTYNPYLVNLVHLISLIDEISFEFPHAPPLSQADDIDPEQFCNSDNRPDDCGDNCRCTHTIDIPLNSVVEVVLIDEVQQPELSHPFHLHGYAFNVIGMGRSLDENKTNIDLAQTIDMDRRGLLDRKFDLPPGKDTIAVPYNGYVILRFIANNPGYWLFHCHFVYHMPIGMDIIFHVGTSADLPPIPPNFPTCGNFLPPITPLN